MAARDPAHHHRQAGRHLPAVAHGRARNPVSLAGQAVSRTLRVPQRHGAAARRATRRQRESGAASACCAARSRPASCAGLGYSNIIEAASVEEELRFLQRGIVDAVFGESAIFHHLLGERIGDSYTVSPTQHTENTWLGGSLDFQRGRRRPAGPGPQGDGRGRHLCAHPQEIRAAAHSVSYPPCIVG
ncbi:hypothetical protein LP420_36190 [Massilia sp. B-10]|nr:hypothetical protein LP420_36190 [Massilia sp. B-10]